MKKVALFLDKNISIQKYESPHYSLKIINEYCSDNIFNCDFFVVHVDSFPNFKDLVKNYKTFSNKFWALTSDLSKENILNLYNCGFDNVLEFSSDFLLRFELLLQKNYLEISNCFFNIKDTERNLLIVKDRKISTKILSVFLKHNFNCIVQENFEMAQKSIFNQKFDLIFTDIENYKNLVSVIDLSPNNNTAIICISKKISKDNLSEKVFLIEETRNVQALKIQIENILKLKNIQDIMYKENNLLYNLIKKSNIQQIITDINLCVITAGSQHLPLKNNDYFFDILSTLGINYPKEEIAEFIKNYANNFSFTINFNSRCYEIVLTKIYSHNHKLENYSILISDITEKIEYEAQKETFIATITHDLKSPIRAESMILKQLITGTFGELNSTQIEILTELLNSREYMNRMVENLLTRYKLSSCNLDLLIKENNYKKIIELALNSTKYLTEEKKQGISVSYNAKSEFFEFDETEIKRVLVNLVANASDYTPSNKELSITVKENEDYIITEVKDNGYGIPESKIADIFDKNVTWAKEYRKVGTGLGLYICKSIIDAHHGKIFVQSKVNEGTTFTYYLPKKYFDIAGKEPSII